MGLTGSSFRDDPIGWADKFYIRPEDAGEPVRFTLRPAQRLLLSDIVRDYNRGKSFHIVLKARRMGISSACMYLAFWLCMTRSNVSVASMAHREDVTVRLKEFFEGFFYDMPEELRQLYKCSPTCTHSPLLCRLSNQDMFFWKFDWGSAIYTATAGSSQPLQGTGQALLHFSEAAFYPKGGKDLIRAVMPTLPKSEDSRFIVVVESTANGDDGWFYQTFMKAQEAEEKRKSGEGSFILWKPHFYPWFVDPRYTYDAGLVEIDGKRVLPPDPSFDEEEAELRQLYGLSDSQLAFRRYVIENELDGDHDAFRVDYPSSVEEAFAASRIEVFPRAKLLAQLRRSGKPKRYALSHTLSYDPRLVPDPVSGELYVFEEPDKRGLYLMGVDTALGVVRPDGGADFSALCIWKWGPKPKVVATLRERYDPEELARKAYIAGAYYNWATICPEQNSGSGRHFIQVLRKMGYAPLWRDRNAIRTELNFDDTIGWKTNAVSKDFIVSEMNSAIKRELVELSDSRLIEEALWFSHGEGRERYVLAKGEGHADLLMAAMIGYAAMRIAPPTGVAEPSRERRYEEALAILRAIR